MSEQFTSAFTNAIKYQCKQTEGLGLTNLLEYKIALVVTDGQIVGYTIDKVVDSIENAGVEEGAATPAATNLVLQSDDGD